MTTKTKAVEPEARPVVDKGFDINQLLRKEPDEIAVTYGLLNEPGEHISLARFGYLQFGGGLFYRPTGFDLGAGAVVCTRVD